MAIKDMTLQQQIFEQCGIQGNQSTLYSINA
jgi:hypothetical protein